jgi:hypothetical protein
MQLSMMSMMVVVVKMRMVMMKRRRMVMMMMMMDDDDDVKNGDDFSTAVALVHVHENNVAQDLDAALDDVDDGAVLCGLGVGERGLEGRPGLEGVVLGRVGDGVHQRVLHGKHALQKPERKGQGGGMSHWQARDLQVQPILYKPTVTER